MFNRPTWYILALAALAALIGGLWQHVAHHPDASSQTMIGQPAPSLTLDDPAGQPHALDEFRGRRVLVNFWASWCAPCMDELPRLARAHAEGATIVGVAVDDPAAARRFLADHPLPYPQRLGPRLASDLLPSWGDRQASLPYSVLLDGQGRILASHLGPLDTPRLRRWSDPRESRF